MDIFAVRLNQLIIESKITKYKLAKKLNYGKATVLNWCAGKNEPKATQIRELAVYFDVTADYLLGLEDETGAKYINSFNGANINASDHSTIKF